MTAIKPLNDISQKWSTNASRAGDAYRDGVRNPRRDWAESAAAADEARRAGLAAADERNAFVSGVQEAGTQKWRDRATSLGPARFRQGVQASQDEFNRGFARYHSVISSVTLPPRGPKGSPENIDRVRAITEALHNEKVGS